MLAFGRLSVKIVCPSVKVAGAVPELVSAVVQVKFPPNAAEPLTLFVLVAVRSGRLSVVQVASLAAPVPGLSVRKLPAGVVVVTIAWLQTWVVPTAGGLLIVTLKV